jgi:hypothetical protein
VVLAGGYEQHPQGVTVVSTIDMYDPASDSWSSGGTLSVPRANHAAFVLSNGLVLIAGGAGYGLPDLSSAELYDPTSHATSPLRPMAQPRNSSAYARIDGCAGAVLGGVSVLLVPNTADHFDAILDGDMDADADCLPDAYESLHPCLNVGINDAAIDPEGDGLMVMSEREFGGNPCMEDLDGCHDLEEAGTNPVLGGQRDPFSPWDFFDVPAPAGPATGSDGKPIIAPSSARNRAISLQDVGVVLAYVGRTPLNPAYMQDNNADGIADGVQMDRTPSSTPGQPWRSGAPNDAVSLQDVAVALAQVGHHCTAPP